MKLNVAAWSTLSRVAGLVLMGALGCANDADVASSDGSSGGSTGGGNRDDAGFVVNVPDGGGSATDTPSGSPPRDSADDSSTGPVDASGGVPVAPVSCSIQWLSPDMPALSPGGALRFRATRTASDELQPRPSWEISYNADRYSGPPVQVTPTIDPAEPALMQFTPLEEGSYTVQARVGGCTAVTAPFRVGHLGVESYWMRVTPFSSPESAPPSRQAQYLSVFPPTEPDVPTKIAEVVLKRAKQVQVTARNATQPLWSYVRLTSQDLIPFEWLEAHTSAGPARFLIERPESASGHNYDLLLVPDDQRYAPMRQRLAVKINADPVETQIVYRLDLGDMEVSGVVTSGGVPVQGAKVILRDKETDPVSGQPLPTLTSTLGYTDAKGAYRLRVRAGVFFPVVLPPATSRLPEAVGTQPLRIEEGQDTRLDVNWEESTPKSTTSTTVTATNAVGAPLAGVTVRLEGEPSGLPGVGSFTHQDQTRIMGGRITIEGVTDAAGKVAFANHPAGSYRMVFIPATAAISAPGPAVKVINGVPLTGEPRTVVLPARVPLNGQLVGGYVDQLRIVATDEVVVRQGDELTTLPTADGGFFTLWLDPNRSFRLSAEPRGLEPLPRLSLGIPTVRENEPIELGEVPLPVLGTFVGHVSLTTGSRWEHGARIQIYCIGFTADCIDLGRRDAAPVFETVSDKTGQFVLRLRTPRK